MTGRPAGTGTRSSYHHGDLRAALVDAALELTRTGGPAALTLREATRRVGVSPNAAYRHFGDRDALVGAVAAVIGQRMARRMQPRGSVTAGTDPAAVAVGRLHAVGLGYIRFALDEPGWFSTAFFGTEHDPAQAPTVAAASSGPKPYQLLVEALDRLVEVGVLSPERRADAEWPCFAAVHGFAELALHGPLRRHSRADLNRLAVRTVTDAVTGVLGEQAHWDA
ncbi:TetR/AcrR family transcriptional regulator [Propionibacteriaceae bacterium Y2011]